MTNTLERINELHTTGKMINELEVITEIFQNETQSDRTGKTHKTYKSNDQLNKCQTHTHKMEKTTPRHIIVKLL